MINILPKKRDDIAFTRIVTQILANLLSRDLPTRVYVVQVDRRFDFKWKGFKGKYLGTASSWNNKRLRVPPFNPKKIVEEAYFEKSGNSYDQGSAARLHIDQRSEFNHERRIESMGILHFSFGTVAKPYYIRTQASWCMQSTAASRHHGLFHSFLRILGESEKH